MLRIIDMREATGDSRAFSVWNTIYNQFLSLNGGSCWDGDQDFTAQCRASSDISREARDRVVRLLPAWALAETPNELQAAEAEYCNQFEVLQETDPWVIRMLDIGFSKEAIIVEKCRMIDSLQKRVMELESIAPKRYQLPDGREMVYRCPVDVLPIQKLMTP